MRDEDAEEKKTIDIHLKTMLSISTNKFVSKLMCLKYILVINLTLCGYYKILNILKIHSFKIEIVVQKDFKRKYFDWKKATFFLSSCLLPIVEIYLKKGKKIEDKNLISIYYFI